MRGLATKTKDLIEFAWLVLQEIQPAGLRALHYNIFSRQQIEYENDVPSYRRLSHVTTYARRLYRRWELHGLLPDPPEFSIDPSWMTDETRALERVSVWDDAAEYADCIKRGYRRDNWQTQPCHCEIWSEKATVLGSIRPITEKWGVGLRVCHGYASTGMEQDVGSLFEGVDKRIVVFYLGDADPSGFQMQEDIHQRAITASGVTFEMRRLAIFLEDIKKFHLPPQKIKPSDSRAAAYKREHGDNAPTVELDALPPPELRQRIETAITGLIDFDDWDRQVAVQEEELKCIVDFADRMKRLPPPPSQAPPAAPAQLGDNAKLKQAVQLLKGVHDSVGSEVEQLEALREAADLLRTVCYDPESFDYPCIDPPDPDYDPNFEFPGSCMWIPKKEYKRIVQQFKTGTSLRQLAANYSVTEGHMWAIILAEIGQASVRDVLEAAKLTGENPPPPPPQEETPSGGMKP